VTNTFTIGGNVTGLSGAGLVLQNNGGDNLAVSTDGAFTFPTAVADGGRYTVTVFTQPSGQGCAVANGSGGIAGANVTSVAITCAAALPAAPTVSLGFGVKELRFTWPAVDGADFYRLSENPDGVSGYTQVATNITALSYNHTIPVHRRLNASYIVDACNSAGCTASAPQILGTNLTRAIGYVKASNSGASDYFGTSVALSGDGNTLAVGAFGEASNTTGIDGVPNELAPGAGAVYVYTRSTGTWSQQAFIKASNTGTNDLFGQSVALSDDGNTLAVGAIAEASSTTGINSTPNELALGAGAVYVFTRSAGTWSQQAYVKASNTGSGDLFGRSVALSGDGNTLAVGAEGEDSGTTGINSTPDESVANAGAAYVFARNAGTWSQQAYVKASNTGGASNPIFGGDAFGFSVALSRGGDTLAVGAPGEASSTTGIDSIPDELANGAGAVYVFTRNAGAWSQQAYVKASNAGTGDNFGFLVALNRDGNTLAVGAIGEASNTTGVDSTPNELAPFAGAAYVYTRIGSTWSQQAYVKASNAGGGDAFGISMALSSDGNMLAVGATGEASSTTGIGSTPNDLRVGAGAVYVYERSAGTWSQKAYVKASNTGAGDAFGRKLALSGDGNTLAVGADFEDSGSTGIGSTPNELATSAGALYLY
jgi:hypothetical protein